VGFIIGLILFGIPSAIVAGVKGFKPFRWLIAFGFIGLIVVATLANANARGISDEEVAKRAEKANKIGAWMAGINLGLGLVILVISLIVYGLQNS
jgi:hypothetical protein